MDGYIVVYSVINNFMRICSNMVFVIATHVATTGVSIPVKPDTNSEKFVAPPGLEPGSLIAPRSNNWGIFKNQF